MNGKNPLFELFVFLQDPHLVASFQRLCGVRGTAREAGRLHPQQPAGAPVLDGRGGIRTQTLTDDDNPEESSSSSSLLERSKLTANGGRLTGATSAETPGQSTLRPRRKNSLTGEAGQEFLIENRFWYYLFTFGTELGNELFYISFFPFIAWNVDPFVGRRIIMLWSWVMYLGQCTKDLVSWPRPMSPPVVKVEMFYNSEYSMPSTHAMSATAIPVALFYMTCERWEYPSTLAFIVAPCWCLLVCVSRIYMGMHSVLDVIAGVLFSAIILLFLLPLLDVIDSFIMTWHSAPLVIVSVHVGLGLFCFTLDTWSTSRSDTAQILGTGSGVALASHVNYRLGLLPDPDRLPLTLPALGAGLVLTCLFRLLLGVLVLMGTRELMKALTIPLLCRLVGLPGHDVRKARQHMEVELPHRYLVYCAVGFNVLFLVPIIFNLLSL
ncbi:sphingosine-1-phosphate phosphatase 1-like [Synchiropus picturatus]